jgi:hypothetical protein
VNILIISSLDSVLESAYDEEEELTWGEEDEDDAEDGNKIKSDSGIEQEQEGNTISSIQEPSIESNENVTDDDSYTRKTTLVETIQISNSGSAGVTDEDALLAAKNIAQLQEANANLSRRTVMLESEVEKLQNQLIKERTLSAKLRTTVSQGEEREKTCTQQMTALQQQLAAAEKEVLAMRASMAASDTGIEPAPLSSGSGSSSIVDLGVEQEKKTQKQETELPAVESNHDIDREKERTRDKEERRHHHDLVELGSSVSEVSLASLQSVSSASVSVSGDSSPPPSSDQTQMSSSTDKRLSITVSNEKQMAGEGVTGVTAAGGGAGAGADVDDEEEEEEEWDNEAWE